MTQKLEKNGFKCLELKTEHSFNCFLRAAAFLFM